MRDHPDEGVTLMRPHWWKTILMRNHPNEGPPWWKTALMRDHHEERPSRWKTTLMRDHLDERPPWWGTTPMKDHPDEGPPCWESPRAHSTVLPPLQRSRNTALAPGSNAARTAVSTFWRPQPSSKPVDWPLVAEPGLNTGGGSRPPLRLEHRRK